MKRGRSADTQSSHSEAQETQASQARHYPRAHEEQMRKLMELHQQLINQFIEQNKAREEQMRKLMELHEQLMELHKQRAQPPSEHAPQQVYKRFRKMQPTYSQSHFLAKLQKEQEFFEIKQGDRPVNQYVRHFEHLAVHAPSYAREPEELKNHFIRGLRLEIQKYAILSSATSYQECVNKALMIEKFDNETAAAKAQPKKSVFRFRKPNFVKKGEGSISAKGKASQY